MNPFTPAHYVLGTKYGNPAADMLPAMVDGGVIGIGLANEAPLDRLVGLEYDQALAELRRLFPDERPDARTQLARFFGLRPGDLVALKAHGSPVGKQPRLVIARYAVVAGDAKATYQHTQCLGHTLAVDYLDEMEPIELALGYGRTLHQITDASRIGQIFGPYARIESSIPKPHPASAKPIHSTRVASRGAYIMSRIHNELQNTVYKFLYSKYGDAVQLEKNNIDVFVTLPNRIILVEVKSSLSPTYCLREALGQMLHYAWRDHGRFSNVSFLVVGPTSASKSDAEFLNHVRQATGLDLAYKTPEEVVTSGGA